MPTSSGSRPCPPPTQIEEVRKELKKRNPEFKGELNAGIENGKVTWANLIDGTLSDITPIRAFADMQRLVCTGIANGKFSDLGVLRGLPLRQLTFMSNAELRDLTPLEGMLLRELNLMNNPQLTDLTPLKGMPLEFLQLWAWSGSDLTPLKGMPLKWLNIGYNHKNVDLRSSPNRRWKLSSSVAQACPTSRRSGACR